MLKSLFPQIEWSRIVHVGFDLDGTLYDEFDFIEQAYRPVARRISRLVGQTEEAVHTNLLLRWLEKGSSYPHIFSEALETGGICTEHRTSIVQQCIGDFRGCEPTLALHPRIRLLLDGAFSAFDRFMVTDGGCAVQRRKIEALGLSRWFDTKNTAISGCLECGAAKPSPRMIDALECKDQLRSHPERVVFFGDRATDRDFASEAGFHFVKVRHMQLVLEQQPDLEV